MVCNNCNNGCNILNAFNLNKHLIRFQFILNQSLLNLQLLQCSHSKFTFKDDFPHKLLFQLWFMTACVELPNCFYYRVNINCQSKAEHKRSRLLPPNLANVFPSTFCVLASFWKSPQASIQTVSIKCALLHALWKPSCGNYFSFLNQDLNKKATNKSQTQLHWR